MAQTTVLDGTAAEPPHDAAVLVAKAERMEEAAAACRRAEELRAGDDVTLGYGGANDQLVRAALTFDAHAQRLRRSALPIAIGDPVLVHIDNAAGLHPHRVVAVGTKRVQLQTGHQRPTFYSLETGCAQDGFGTTWIIEADLHRIRRDLLRKTKTTR